MKHDEPPEEELRWSRPIEEEARSIRTAEEVRESKRQMEEYRNRMESELDAILKTPWLLKALRRPSTWLFMRSHFWLHNWIAPGGFLSIFLGGPTPEETVRAFMIVREKMDSEITDRPKA